MRWLHIILIRGKTSSSLSYVQVIGAYTITDAGYSYDLHNYIYMRATGIYGAQPNRGISVAATEAPATMNPRKNGVSYKG